MLRRTLIVLFLNVTVCGALIGCSSTGSTSSPLVPEQSIRIFSGYNVALEDVVQVAGVAAAVYYLIDPLSPNWEIKETRLSESRVLYDLKMKAVHNGGDGEARYVLAKRVAALMREQGFDSYEIVRYEEAMDSRWWLPHRTAEAEVILRKVSVPDA